MLHRNVFAALLKAHHWTRKTSPISNIFEQNITRVINALKKSSKCRGSRKRGNKNLEERVNCEQVLEVVGSSRGGGRGGGRGAFETRTIKECLQILEAKLFLKLTFVEQKI